MQEDPAVQALRGASQAMTALGDAWQHSMQTTLQAVNSTLQALYDMWYAEYLAQGAPFGESHEGMTQWLHAVGEINRHQAAADRLREDLAWKVWVRQWGIEQRAKRPPTAPPPTEAG